MTALVAQRVWLDSLRPITDAQNNLVDIIAVVNVEFADNGDKFVKNTSISTISLFSPEQVGVVQGLYQQLIDALKAQYEIA